jgi:uncharacterized protein YaaN involved in tellurite resistance
MDNDLDKTVENAEGKEMVPPDAINTGNSIRIVDQIGKETVDNLTKLSKQCLPKFEEDQSAIDNLGKDVFDNLTSVIDRELDRPDRKNDHSKEINDIVRSMTGEFQNTVSDYGGNDSTISKASNSISNWISEKRYKWKMKKFDSKSLLERFQHVKVQLTQQNAILDSNISWGRSMMDESTKSAKQLMKFIALIEIVRDDANKQIVDLQEHQKQLSNNTIEWQDNQARISNLAFIVHKLDIKHTEYISALFDAYNTNAQIMNIITISDGIKNKTNHIMNYTINKMKNVVVQIEFMIQTRGIAAMDDNIEKSTETALDMQRRLSEEGTKYITSISESPDTTRESILASAASIVKQNNAYMEAIEEGRRQRQDVEQAAIEGIHTISENMSEKNIKTIQRMLDPTSNNDKPIEDSDSTESIEKQTLNA